MNGTQLDAMIEQCETTETLKLLAHPQRLQLLCHLSEKELTVTDLEGLCGISQSQLSQFLQRMKSERLVVSRREGKFVHYSISDPKIRKLIQALHKIFCS
jgi:ArsR family transcriptional regulator